MSYQSIKKLYRSGNIVAAKAALVEALKNNTLTAVEKKSVIRLNSEPLLEAYVAFMPPEPKKWEIMEIVHTYRRLVRAIAWSRPCSFNSLSM